MHHFREFNLVVPKIVHLDMLRHIFFIAWLVLYTPRLHSVASASHHRNIVLMTQRTYYLIPVNKIARTDFISLNIN